MLWLADAPSLRALAARLDDVSGGLAPRVSAGLSPLFSTDQVSRYPELAHYAGRLRSLRQWCEATSADLRRRAAIAEQADAVALDPVEPPAVRSALIAAASGTGDAALSELRLLLAADGAGPGRDGKVAAFFAALPPDAALAVALAGAALVGPLGGVPYDLRYAANRLLIRQARAEAGALWLTDRVALYSRLLEPREVRTVRDGRVVSEKLPRQFLLFDPSGQGRVAEVFGDLDTATSVAVTVPGTGNNLGTYGDGPGANARALHDFAERFSGGRSATIAWMGCDLPQSLPQATWTSYAEAGGPMLRDFVTGLRLSADVRATLVGHSYGSTVTGHAVSAGLRPGSLVAVASPGWGVYSADDLHAPGTRMYALRHPHDAISVAPVLSAVSKAGLLGLLATPWAGHGQDPILLAGVTRLATGTDGDLVQLGLDIDAHGDYFTTSGPTTLSISNIARVILGKRPITFLEARASR
ncbi:alpha/beta hydrolase [Microtetraspora sp. NBRC 16547]|uniref:alpha/beta hydrolase n=1 Tax=Microtetraspora sp. NBRC 16547 TaxID=3030993 RepID=UPI002556B927|nr:alpha/beta hydrolase [Microtetraspora sp. NBRC 16547]